MIGHDRVGNNMGPGKSWHSVASVIGARAIPAPMSAKGAAIVLSVDDHLCAAGGTVVIGFGWGMTEVGRRQSAPCDRQ